MCVLRVYRSPRHSVCAHRGDPRVLDRGAVTSRAEHALREGMQQPCAALGQEQGQEEVQTPPRQPHRRGLVI